MSTIVACPKCGKAVTAIDAADLQAWMRCPCCGDQYQLRTALAVQPPKLEPIVAAHDQPLDAVLAAQGQNTVQMTGSDFPVLHPDSSGETDIAPMQHRSGDAPVNFNSAEEKLSPEGEVHLTEHFSAIPVSNVVEKRVAQAKQNVPLELVKIVLGGAVGLLLGYAVLLWGFHVDPFKTSRYLPHAVVPEKLAPQQP